MGGSKKKKKKRLEKSIRRLDEGPKCGKKSLFKGKEERRRGGKLKGL